MKKKLVVVESPTKARTIRKFLDSEYIVESCMGHVRDLPKSKKEIPEKYRKEVWAHLGVNVEKNFTPFYCVSKDKGKRIKLIKSKLKDMSELILATDEDREGESISWHLVEVLKPKILVKRIAFHEITQSAIDRALKEGRDIDQNLVRAQETRRILDRLVGYTLSPLLWKKVAYGLSAGRVQSVAMRLIAEREHERFRFVKASYWSLSGFFKSQDFEGEKADNPEFEAKLYSYQGKRVAIGSDFDRLTGALISREKGSSKDEGRSKSCPLLLLDEKKVKKIVFSLKDQTWRVDEVKEKPFHRKPFPPFITSTLQQEANRKLNFSSKQTMDVAQKLYEKGLITYMRTDSTSLSREALFSCRSFISKRYGSHFLPSTPRVYSAQKVKGAQEAHEAIRPAGDNLIPPEKTDLSGFEQELYDLIWKRTLASQMKDAKYQQTQVKIGAGEAVFHASGMSLEFEGFLKLYLETLKTASKHSKVSELSYGEKRRESFAGVEGVDQEKPSLPKLKQNEALWCQSLTPHKNETRPPPRYTEASLIQSMEKNGIGRPSTYASILTTVQNRGYVRKQGRTLYPTFVCLVVSKLFGKYFPNYVDVEFTSEMEEALDHIAQGKLDWVTYLKSIYSGKKGLKYQVEQKEKEIDGDTAKAIQIESIPSLVFRVGRYGAYVCRKSENGEGSQDENRNHQSGGAERRDVCASIPEKLLPGDMTVETARKLIDQKMKGSDALGVDPQTGLKVYVLTGRYGPYVQLGEGEMSSGNSSLNSKGGGKERKPKRVSLFEGRDPESFTLEEALELLSLPKTLGVNPETKEPVQVGLGRFGPYVVHKGDFRSIPKTQNLFELNLEEALELLSREKKRGRQSRSTVIKTWEKKKGQTHQKIQLLSGPYGLYIRRDKKNISLPKDVQSEEVTLDQVLKWVEDKKDLFPKKRGEKDIKK